LSRLDNGLIFQVKSDEKAQCFCAFSSSHPFSDSLVHLWMLLVDPRASLGHSLVTLVAPSGIVGFLLASLCSSLGCFWLVFDLPLGSQVPHWDIQCSKSIPKSCKGRPEGSQQCQKAPPKSPKSDPGKPEDLPRASTSGQENPRMDAKMKTHKNTALFHHF
jgi:hypothetical protein